MRSKGGNTACIDPLMIVLEAVCIHCTCLLVRDIFVYSAGPAVVVRLKVLEEANAMKCYTVASVMAGLKTVQQPLKCYVIFLIA